MATSPATAAGGGADDACLAGEHPAAEQPGQGGRGRRGVGDYEGVGGLAVGGAGAAGVEAEPTEPQDSRAENDVRDVMRLHRLLAVSLAAGRIARPLQAPRHPAFTWIAVPPAKSRALIPSGSRMPRPAGAEDPVRDRVVNEERPGEHEDEECAELGALSEGAGDQRWRDDGEHRLEDHERFEGHACCRRVRIGGHQAYVLEPEDSRGCQ